MKKEECCVSKGHEKVLVVDDQAGIRQLLHEILQDENYDVRVAENGKKSLEILQEYQPEIILLDMTMPVMGGLEVLRELRKLPVHARTIMLTAYGEAEYVDKAKELGAYAYITKPFDIVKLCNMLAKACGRVEDDEEAKYAI